MLYGVSNASLTTYTNVDWLLAQMIGVAFVTDAFTWEILQYHGVQGSKRLFYSQAEFRALALNVSEIVWVQRLLAELQFHMLHCPVVLCDNVSIGYLARNPMLHARTKNVEIDFHFIHKKIASGDLQVADIMIKSLSTQCFQKLRTKLIVFNRPSV